MRKLKNFIVQISGSPEKAATDSQKGVKHKMFEAMGARVVDDGDMVLHFSDKRLVFLTSLVVFLTVAIGYFFVIWSVGFTSSDKFCMGCHEMQRLYDGWRNSSHFDNDVGIVATCADCHLPTDTASKIKVKLVRGVKDTMVHYFGRPNDLNPMLMAENSRRGIGNDSCQMCHKNLYPPSLTKGGLLAHRSLEKDRDIRCVSCHQRFVHF